MEGHCCTNYTSQRLLGYPDATGRWREYCAYQSVAKLLFLLEKESQVVPTSSGAMLHQSTVSLATLTFKPAYAILCGLLNITLLVPPQHKLRIIHRLAPVSPSSAAVVSPGSWRCWVVTALPLLAWSSNAQQRSSWTSAVNSRQTPSLTLNLWSPTPPPLHAHSLQMQVCSMGSGFPTC